MRSWAGRAVASLPRWLPQVVVSVVAVGLVGSVLRGYFGAAGGVWFGLAGAALLGAVVAVAVARRPPVGLVAGHVAGFLAVAAVVLRPEGSSWQPPTVVLADVWRGWGRMLSVNLPADPMPELLTLPLLLSWTAAFVTVVTVIRSAHPFAPVVPLLAAHVVALLLVAGLHAGHVAATAALALCFGALARLRVRHTVPGRPATSWTTARGGRAARTVHTAMTVLVISGVVGAGALGALGVTTVLPGRFDPRTVDPPPVAVRPSVTPLTLVTTQRRQPPKPLFHVRVRSEAPIDRVRTAVLDTYDGTTWSSSARFLVAGRVLPAVSPDQHGQPVGMTVLLETWRSPFLPVLGTPTGLTGSDVAGVQAGYDGSTQTLVWSGPTPPGTTYAVTGVVPAVDDGLRSAPLSPAGAVDAPPPDVPAALRSVADVELGGPGTPLERLRRLEAFLRSRPYDLAAPAGHSFAALEQVTTQVTEGVGNDEQHAAAFALLARLAGFPARVAVGYLLPAAGPDGVHHVTSHDAHAWPEVRFAGYGWIPFEPTDTTRRPPAPVPVAQASMVPPPPPPPPTFPTPAPPVATPLGPARGAPPVAFLAVALPAGVVLAAAAIVLAKTLRRAVRRRGTAHARLCGAWAEAVDTLGDRAFAGRSGRRLVLTPALTPGEIALRADDAFGVAAGPLAELASMVTASTFGDVAVSTGDADRAWLIVDGLRRTAGRPRGLPGRARAALDPRSLVRWRTARGRARRAFRALGLEVT